MVLEGAASNSLRSADTGISRPTALGGSTYSNRARISNITWRGQLKTVAAEYAYTSKYQYFVPGTMLLKMRDVC